MYLSAEQMITLLTTLLFLELFVGALLVWALYRVRQMQQKLGGLGRDKYKELLEWQQETRFALMEQYKAELATLTEKAAERFEKQLDSAITELQEASADGRQKLEQQLTQQNQKLAQALTTELQEYKQEKIAELEQATDGLARKAASQLISAQIDTASKHQIVTRLLETAWEDGELENE